VAAAVILAAAVPLPAVAKSAATPASKQGTGRAQTAVPVPEVTAAHAPATGTWPSHAH
jgi:hypothetical protein